MDPLRFDEVITLLNHSRTTHIEPTPIRGSEGAWSLHEGFHRVHTSKYPFRVLALQSRITKTEMTRLAKELGSHNSLQVVYAPSISGSPQDVFPKTTQGIWTYKDYLISFIKDELATYISTVTGQKPQFYIDPRLEVPSGFPRKLPNPLLNFLTDAKFAPDGAVAIVLAPPGQGKTYMCRHIVATLAKRRPDVVPILIESLQWHNMSLTDLASLPKTIAHSFRHCEAPIGWIEGHEDVFLNLTLKADLFRIVFDGFDEYVLRNRGSLRPVEVLEALSDLATATASRIVLTCRTSFWDLNLPQADVEAFVEKKNFYLYEMLPFDNASARNYFRERFKADALVNEASSIYEMLRRENEEFVGRGFVLSLVADLVERGGSKSTLARGGKKAIQWVFEALCEREALRQQLPLSKDDQIDALTSFAADVATGDRPTTETLEYHIRVARPDLPPQEVSSCMIKLTSHPLIERAVGEEKWEFKQSQIAVVLLAVRLLNLDEDQLRTFVPKIHLDAGLFQDLVITIVSLVRAGISSDAALIRISALVAVLRTIKLERTRPGNILSDGRRLGASIMLAGIESLLPKGTAHVDRTMCLRTMCRGGAVSDFVFSGTIARFDLTGVTFSGCMFDNVVWANCKFDETTCFDNCSFIGGMPPLHCEGFGVADFDKSQMDAGATAYINAAQIADGKRAYTVDNLRADIVALVSKFIAKGGWALKTVAERNLTKGTIGASRYKDEIVKAFKIGILEDHHVSGVSQKVWHVRESVEECVRFYASNNVFTGALAELYDDLRSDLSV
jgi:hypothetical protein